jgi:hypothetical protein
MLGVSGGLEFLLLFAPQSQLFPDTPDAAYAHLNTVLSQVTL